MAFQQTMTGYPNDLFSDISTIDRVRAGLDGNALTGGTAPCPTSFVSSNNNFTTSISSSMPLSPHTLVDSTRESYFGFFPGISVKNSGSICDMSPRGSISSKNLANTSVATDNSLTSFPTSVMYDKKRSISNHGMNSTGVAEYESDSVNFSSNGLLDSAASIALYNSCLNYPKPSPQPVRKVNHHDQTLYSEPLRSYAPIVSNFDALASQQSLSAFSPHNMLSMNNYLDTLSSSQLSSDVNMKPDIQILDKYPSGNGIKSCRNVQVEHRVKSDAGNISKLVSAQSRFQPAKVLSSGLHCIRKGPRSRGRKRCEAPNCVITANYGYPGSSAKFCSAHRLHNMVLLYAKFCETPKCNRRAIFREVGGHLKYCKEHKEDGMVTSQKFCSQKECRTQARFGRLNESQRWCHAHKSDDMVKIGKGRNFMRSSGNTLKTTTCLESPDKNSAGSNVERSEEKVLPAPISAESSQATSVCSSSFGNPISAKSFIYDQPIAVVGCPLEHLAQKLTRLSDMGFITKDFCDKEIAQAVQTYREKITSACNPADPM